MAKVLFISYIGDKISYRDLLEDVKYSIPEEITGMISMAFDKLDP